MTQEMESKQCELESNTTDFRHNRYERFLEIAKGYEEAGEQLRADYARMDAMAFALHHYNKRSFPGYFQPMMEMTDGRTYPPLDFFTDERLKYYSNRARSTNNPIHASRFADVAWDLSKKKDPDMARLAVDNYMDCATQYKINRWGVEFGEVIKRAVALAVLISDTGRLARLKQLIIAELQALNKDRDYRFCLDLAEALAAMPLILTQAEQDAVIAILDNGDKYYRGKHPKREGALGPTEGPNEHLARSCMEAKANLLQVWKRPEANSQSIKRELAQSYERESQAAMGDKRALAALVFLTDAEKLYGEAGLASEQKRIRVLMAGIGKVAESEMKRIETKVEIKHEEMDEYISPLIAESLQESLERLAVAHHFYPSVAVTTKNVENQKQQHPLQFLFQRVYLKDGHVIGQAKSEQELLDDVEIRDFCLGIQIGGIFRTRLFERLKTEKALTADRLLEHFKRWGFCSEESLILLNIGFAHYFKGDYVSSLHVLLPQFEAVLRGLLERAGRPISDPQRGKFIILSSLLEDELLNTCAGEDLIQWYKISLVEPKGLNLRNNVLHGLCPTGQMTTETAELVIHLLLSLTRFTI